MGRFSILSRKSRLEEKPTPVLTEDLKGDVPRETLRFPVNETGGSLAEMAQRDLEAALQLLAERAQYITGASGAAIALRKKGDIICRASAGASAPEVGVHLQINSGLSGESIRTREILRCDDAEADPRVNRESCRALGIASVVVLPLVNENEVNGVFELFSGRVNAFEERDISALQRLAEMIQTAIQHSELAKRAEQELAVKEDEVLSVQSGDAAAEAESGGAEEVLEAAAEPAASVAPVADEKVFRDHEVQPPPPVEESAAPLVAADGPTLAALGHIKTCETCGFPISESRTVCLDCEAHQVRSPADEFFSQYQPEKSWIASNKYLIGIVLMVLATLVVVIYFR